LKNIVDTEVKIAASRKSANEDYFWQYPFLGIIIKNRGKVAFKIEKSIGFSKSIPWKGNDTPNLPDGTYLLTTKSHDIWVKLPGGLYCRSQYEYRELRKKYLESLSPNLFLRFISGEPKSTNVGMMKLSELQSSSSLAESEREDTELVLCVVKTHLKKHKLGSTSFKKLAVAMNESNSLHEIEVLEDIIKDKLRHYSIPSVEFEQAKLFVLNLPISSLDFEINIAIRWLDSPIIQGNNEGYKSALEVFRPEQLLEWSMVVSLSNCVIEKVCGELKKHIPITFERTLCSQPEFTPAGYKLLAECVNNDRISLDLVFERMRTFPDSQINCMNLLSASDQINFLLEDGRHGQLLDSHEFNAEEKLQILHGLSLSIDIEGSEDGIRELGWCYGTNEMCGGQDILSELDGIVQSSRLIVGHNILKWDMPLLEKCNVNFPNKVPVWDTLLVSFILEPWKQSHALCGDHTALGDAKRCRALFLEQVKRIGADKVFALLQLNLDSQTHFYRSLCQVIPHFDSQQLPSWLPKSLNIIALPNAWMTTLYWCSRVAVGRSDGFFELSQISTLMDNHSPECTALATVLQRAEDIGIVLHKSMVPRWLIEGNDIKEAIENSKSNSWRNIDGIQRIISFNEIDERIFHQLDAVTVHEGSTCFLQRVFQTQHELFGMDEAHSRNALIQLSERKDVIMTWAHFDQLQYQTQAPEWKKYSAWGLKHQKTITLNHPKDIEVILNKTAWSQEFLHPSSHRQADYWMEVLMRFEAIAKCKDGQGIVPILIIVSAPKNSKVIGFLDDAFNELGWMIYKGYHSRSRRSQLACSEGRFLVCHIEDLYQYYALAEAFSFMLVPIFESVPLEEWYITSNFNNELDQKEYPNLDDEAGIYTNLDDEDDILDDDECLPSHYVPEKLNQKGIASGVILKEAATLLEKNFSYWFLANAGRVNGGKCWIIDPRVQAKNKHDDFLVDISLREKIYACFRGIDQPKYEAPKISYDALRKHTGSWFARGEDFDFREYQQEAVKKVLERNEDILIRLPTGKGKTLIFQAPILYRSRSTRRLSLVISPLRALMQDQVISLNDKGIIDEVDYLSSERPWFETNEVYQGIQDGRICLLYIAPERFRSRRFIEALARRIDRDGSLEYAVFDEAHCISLWGNDFRPDYLFAAQKLAEIRNELRNYPNDQDRERQMESFPVLCLSATVPEKVREEIQNALKCALTSLPSIPEDPIRSDITISPIQVKGDIHQWKPTDWDLESRFPPILNSVEKAHRESAVIVFVRRRQHAEYAADCLREMCKNSGRPVPTIEYFHAGLDAERKNDIYEQYKRGETQVLIATKAFGMGMDISHIHWVTHLSPPNYIEDYLQEIGRIGRDKSKVITAGLNTLEAQLLYNDGDYKDARDKRAKSRIGFDDINKLWEVIHLNNTENSKYMLPDYGIPEAKIKGVNKVRMSLYWLEEMNRISIIRMVPSCLEINLSGPSILNQFIEDPESDPDMCALARALLHSTSEDECNSEVTGVKNGIISGLVSTFLRIFGFGTLSEYNINIPKQEKKFIEGKKTITVSLIELAAEVSQDADRVLSVLKDIPGIEWNRTLSFKEGKVSKDISDQVPKLMDWLEDNCSSLLAQCKGKRKEPIDWYTFGITFPSFEKTRTLQSKGSHEMPILHPENIKVSEPYPFADQRLESFLIEILKLCGAWVVRRDQDDGSFEWILTLYDTRYEKRYRKVERIVKLIPVLWQVITPFSDENSQISMSSLIGAASSKFSKWEIEQSLYLISVLKLASTEDQLLPMAYQLLINDSAPFSEDDREILGGELKEREELAELRCHAMEVFSHLAGQYQSDFVRQYFRQGKLSGLKKLLNDSLSEGQNSSPWSEGKLEEINKESFNELFHKYNPSYPNEIKQEDSVAEPEQWKAISHPYDQHIIVNAGPGAGKTSALVARVVHLIHNQGLQPNQILVLAFNRAVVYEIKCRVKEIFRGLGFGNFTSGLRIHTFHALAMKNVDQKNDFDKINLIQIFLKQLIGSASKAKDIAGNVRAILVDEFQDMDDELYNIVKDLQAASKAGLFVIGDDDQDIVEWKPSRKGSSCEKYFDSYIKEFNPTEITFKVNFRSTKQIVEFSQNQIRHLPGRKKQKIVLETANLSEAVISCCDQIEWSTLNEEDNVKRIADEMKFAREEKKSIAILCRSNNDVSYWYHQLNDTFPELTVKVSSANYKVSLLRHVAVWIDQLKKEKGNATLNEDLYRKTIEWAQVPETRLPDSDEKKQLRNLWCWFQKESPDAGVEALIEFIQAIDLDDYNRMEESEENKGFHAIISTIHKVKGMEYDSVVILPPPAEFNDTDAMAKAKTYYVAMTRAKSRLLYFVGEGKKYGDSSSMRLIGNIKKEVILSRSAKKNDFQNHIYYNVKIGDDVQVINGQVLRHSGIEVGKLVNTIAAKKLSVAAIIRYSQNREDSYFQRYPEEWSRLSEEVKSQGWSWVVLVKE